MKFTLPVNEHGNCTIEARVKDTEEMAQVLTAAY